MEIFSIWIILSWFGIFSDKCFLLVWIGKRGWVVGGALFENLQSHRWNIRRPKFSLCHEIWWTLNPTFKWEKISHQDTIYPQLMSLRRKLWSNAIAESDLNLTHTYLRISWNNHLMKTQLQFVENKEYFVLSLSWNMCFLEFLWTGNGIRSQGWDGIWSWGNLFWYYLTTIKKLYCSVRFIWGAWGWGWGSGLCRNALHTSHTWTQAMVITLSIQRPARTCGQLCNQGIVLHRIYMAVWESSQKRHFTMQYLWVSHIHLPKHNWLGQGA